MTFSTDLSNHFLKSLRQKQKHYNRRLIQTQAFRTLPPALLIGATLHFGVSTSWQYVAAGTVGVWLAGILLGCWNQWFSLYRTAMACDCQRHNKSTIVNALEINNGDYFSSFAAYAVAEGIKALETVSPSAGTRLKFPLFFYASTVAVCIVTWSAGTLFGSFGNLNTLMENDSSGSVESFLSQTRDDDQRINPELVPAALPFSIDGNAPDAQPGRGNAPGLVAARPNGSESAAGQETASQTSEHQKNATDAPGNSSESGKTLEALSAEEPDQALNASLLATGELGSGFERGRKSRRNRNLRNRTEVASGGDQPLLPDNAPPAGRELGEDKEGEGEPDNGRGGPNGDKKSRGTASMLPVTPLPDMINGLLSPGEETKVPQKALPADQDNHFSTAAHVAAKHEPMLYQDHLPMNIRRNAGTIFKESQQ